MNGMRLYVLAGVFGNIFKRGKFSGHALYVVMEENYRKFIGKEKGVIAKQPFGGRVWGGCGADSNVPAGIWKNTWYMAGS